MIKKVKKAKKISKKSRFKVDAPFLVSISIVGMLLLVIGVLLDAHLNQPQNKQSDAFSNCQPNAILVNPCRPLFGGAVLGDPHAASDPISQFNYYESIIGHPLDIFHDYHSPTSTLPLNDTEKYFAQRTNTYIYVNWKPASNWADAGGNNATVNANIDKAATSIKSIAPNKIFLTIWHEPENDVSPGTSTCAGLKGSAGSPAQYIAMWQNVENRFNADGVTNVVWVMNYMGYQPWDCLVTQLWPGNNLVDWVTYDMYSTSDSTNWANTIGRFYNVLSSDSNSTTNFDSKPWGLGEFGDCQTKDQAHVYQYYQQAKAALDANTYPNLKMYMIYDNVNGPGAGPGCLTDYAQNGTYDPTEQSNFNQFANDPIFTQAPTPTFTPTPTPSLTPTPTPTPTPLPTPTAVPTVAPIQLFKTSSYQNGVGSSWKLNVISPAAASISTTTNAPVAGTYVETIAVTKASPNLWYVQLKQPNISLTAGKTYTVIFWAKASIDQKIESVLQQVQGAHTLYAKLSPNVTPQWQKFTYTYRPTELHSDVFLGFNLAQKVNTISLDAISLTSN